MTKSETMTVPRNLTIIAARGDKQPKSLPSPEITRNLLIILQLKMTFLLYPGGVKKLTTFQIITFTNLNARS